MKKKILKFYLFLNKQVGFDFSFYFSKGKTQLNLENRLFVPFYIWICFLK